jgi:hypothetical protein
MRFLRTLALLLGRMFDRLASALLSWSRGPDAGPDSVGWAEAREDGPPEHWIRYIRQRAPWLVRGNRPAPPDLPVGRAARPVERPEQALESARAPEPPRPAGGRPRMILSPPESPAARPGVTEPESHNRAVSAPGTGPVPVPPVVRRADTPAGATVMAPAGGPSRDLIPATVADFGRARRGADSGAPPVARVIYGGPGVLEAGSPVPRGALGAPPSIRAAGVGVEWPELPMRAPAEKLEFSGDNSGIDRTRPEAAIAGMWTVGGSAPPKPIAEGRQETAAGASAQPGLEFLEEDRWPDLPDTRSRGAEWEVPSSRSLEREQHRLTRLRAEQAGSSWSGPHS